MTYHVTCNTDDNYAQHCCAMLCSLFENNKGLDFRVHILTNKLSRDNEKQISNLCGRYDCGYKIYEVDEGRLEGVKFRKENPLTKAAYYRILLPDILDKNVNRVLYLDCDIIILENIEEIFSIEIDDYALAACIDSCPYTSLHRNQLALSMLDKAFCSGIMMINLDYWRVNNAVEKLLDFSKRERGHIYLHDQDSLNYVFKNKWLVLPPKWNRGVMSFFQKQPNEKYFDFVEYDAVPKLIHYANHMIKPWFDVSFPEKCYYMKYLKLSGFDNKKFIRRTTKEKIFVYKASIAYYVNKYVRPFVPHFVEIVVKDVCDIAALFFALFFNRSTIKKRMLNRRLIKY